MLGGMGPCEGFHHHLRTSTPSGPALPAGVASAQRYARTLHTLCTRTVDTAVPRGGAVILRLLEPSVEGRVPGTLQSRAFLTGSSQPLRPEDSCKGVSSLLQGFLALAPSCGPRICSCNPDGTMHTRMHASCGGCMPVLAGACPCLQALAHGPQHACTCRRTLCPKACSGKGLHGRC